jgi:sugar phosphate permease
MVLFIGLACMMAAINNVITSMVPLDNRDKMDSGLSAGLLDTLCYLGSATAGTLLGAIAKSSWTNVLIVLFVIAAIGAVLSLAFSFVSKKKDL